MNQNKFFEIWFLGTVIRILRTVISDRDGWNERVKRIREELSTW